MLTIVGRVTVTSRPLNTGRVTPYDGDSTTEAMNLTSPPARSFCCREVIADSRAFSGSSSSRVMLSPTVIRYVAIEEASYPKLYKGFVGNIEYEADISEDDGV